jgi:hypothetical protein
MTYLHKKYYLRFLGYLRLIGGFDDHPPQDVPLVTFAPVTYEISVLSLFSSTLFLSSNYSIFCLVFETAEPIQIRIHEKSLQQEPYPFL